MKSIIYFLFAGSIAWSQENAGPHKGYIHSTGPYQMELILEKNGSLLVYLLDSELKNETVKASEVGVFVKSGNVESEMNCQPKGDTHFECHQNGKVFRKGELAVTSKRDGVRSEEVKIKFPFAQTK